MSTDIAELVAAIARSLADDPDAVRVTVSDEGKRKCVHLSVATGDLGRIIGREGRVANAIRSVIAASADDESWSLEIED